MLVEDLLVSHLGFEPETSRGLSPFPLPLG